MRSKTSSSNADINPSRNKGNGYDVSCKDTSPTTPCPATPTRSHPSAPRWHPGGATLAQGAAAPQPAHTPQLDTDGPHHQTMATTRPTTASLPRRALRRQNPRQEPSAVIPHAGICAGGRPQGRSLPRTPTSAPWSASRGSSRPGRNGRDGPEDRPRLRTRRRVGWHEHTTHFRGAPSGSFDRLPRRPELRVDPGGGRRGGQAARRVRAVGFTRVRQAARTRVNSSR